MKCKQHTCKHIKEETYTKKTTNNISQLRNFISPSNRRHRPIRVMVRLKPSPTVISRFYTENDIVTHCSWLQKLYDLHSLEERFRTDLPQII